MRSRLIRTAALGFVLWLVAVALFSLPVFQSWEEDLGLSALYHGRGPVPAPQDIVLVSIDKSTSAHYQLPNLARKWPRTMHVRLLQRLRKAGVQGILMDIHFREPRPGTQDAELAQAIRDAGKVVLFEFIQKSMVTNEHNGYAASIAELVPPLDLFADAAFDLAPNPLPKVPVKVGQFWKFVPDAGDVPSLPALAFQMHYIGAYEELLRVLQDFRVHDFPQLQDTVTALRNTARLSRAMRGLRQAFQQSPGLVAQVRQALQEREPDPARREILQRVLQLYTGEASQYINYYGPPHTIETIPYYQVLEQDDVLERLRGKLVFVGFSESRQWEQQDGFYSIYSDPVQGLDISGVEITATAAANLIEGRAVHAFTHVQHIFAYGLIAAIFALLYFYLRGAYLVLAVVVAGAVYYLLAQHWFNDTGAWWPVTIPLIVQAPLILISGLLMNYQETQRERQNIQRVFGYYLPKAEVNRLAHDMTSLRTGGQLVHGVCLLTDAQQYTHLSETMPPQMLADFMNRYYEKIFEPIRGHGGIISDVVGDSVLALWAGPADSLLDRANACHAALAVLDAVAAFNRAHPELQLPTRVGVHSGDMLLGHIGALDHYEYRAVGDIVNSASRIEGMNKYLGTRCLVSAQLLDGLSGLASREMGRFLLAGKITPITLHELYGREAELDADTRNYWSSFELALRLFQQGEWERARRGFASILEARAGDGPARFYRDMCVEYLREPPAHWRGFISMAAK